MRAANAHPLAGVHIHAMPLRAVVVVAASVFATGASSTGVLDPAGPIGAAQKTILLNSLFIMLAIVVPTIVATLGFAWWFRASNRRAEYRGDWAYSGQLELVTWSIPILVIVFLGGIAWIGSHDLDPAKPLDSAEKPLEIQVVSLDWKWLFVLPDEGIASVNEIVVPTGRPLAFRLTSASVMNAFFVPQLGSLIYTMNGMTTRLNLQADRDGTFEGLSSHFSGDGFVGMRFHVKAVPAEAFSGWIAGAKAAGEALDRVAYEALARQSHNVEPRTYRSVEPGLFDAIVRHEIAPSAGPEPLHQAGALPRSADICTPASPSGTRAAAMPSRRGG